MTTGSCPLPYSLLQGGTETFPYYYAIHDNQKYITFNDCINWKIDSGDLDAFGKAKSYVDNNITNLRTVLTQFMLNEIDNVYGYIQSQASAINAVVEQNRVDRVAADEYLVRQDQQIREDYQKADNNILQSAYNFASDSVSASVASVTSYVDGIAGLINGRVDEVANLISDVRSALGKIIEDPLGWILRVFKVVLVDWLIEEVAELIAGNPDVLPPRTNFKQRLIDADLI